MEARYREGVLILLLSLSDGKHVPVLSVVVVPKHFVKLTEDPKGTASGGINLHPIPPNSIEKTPFSDVMLTSELHLQYTLPISPTPDILAEEPLELGKHGESNPAPGTKTLQNMGMSEGRPL